MTEAGVRLFVDCDYNEERAAAHGQRLMRMLALLLREDLEGE